MFTELLNAESTERASSKAGETQAARTNWTNCIRHNLYRLDRRLHQLPWTRQLLYARYCQRLRVHQAHLPALNTEGASLVQALQATGVCVLPIENLGLGLTKPMLQEAIALAQELAVVANPKTDWLSVPQSDLMDYPNIILWGLETQLLRIIHHYLGLSVYYQGCSLRRDLANGTADTIRQWHVDWEDYRVIKVIVYLNDVDEEGGCYDYIPRLFTASGLKALNYNLGYQTDACLEQIVPRSQWRSCPGPRGTVVITDTGSVFHRLRPPVSRDRFSVSFCYTSDRPKVQWVAPGVSAQQWQAIAARLDEEQRRYLVHRNSWRSLPMEPP